jgi:putative transposase
LTTNGEENKDLTGRQVGLDVGLSHFYTDSFGEKVDNPKFLRKKSAKLNVFSAVYLKLKKEARIDPKLETN